MKKTPAHQNQNDGGKLFHRGPTNELTHVDLMWIKGKIEFRIRFGRASEHKNLDRHRRIMSFAAGTIFAFVRWARNDFGTIISRIDIVRAVQRDEIYQTLPFIRPGGESLLRLNGWPKVEKVLQAIDGVEALKIDPCDVAPDHWRHVHNRLSANFQPQTYSKDQHEAWLRRRSMMS